MSEENVQTMARAIAALKARDPEGIDDLFHEEVEWRPALTAGGGVEGVVYRGRSGMAKYLEDVDSGFEEVTFDIASYVPVGTNRVLYRGRMLARGKSSGVRLDVAIFGLWEICDGKLIRGQGFFTHAEALQAAGLSE
jgi:ketosteroid isomerase-like protein